MGRRFEVAEAAWYRAVAAEGGCFVCFGRPVWCPKCGGRVGMGCPLTVPCPNKAPILPHCDPAEVETCPPVRAARAAMEAAAAAERESPD